MFTGLIERTGKIIRIQPLARGKKLLIDPGEMFELKLGDSVALDGACFTVVRLEGNCFEVELSPESLEKTTFAGKQPGSKVNIERPLKLSDRLGGHLVLGHVDGVGRIVKARKNGEFVEMEIEAPGELADLLVEKGSVAVDGISLTANALSGSVFSVTLIPETLKRTCLGTKKVGETVNLETDIIGKYVARLLSKKPASGGLSLEKLREEGY
jgi:riboflavin synthase